MGVLLQGFFFGPGKIHGVPSPTDGDNTVPFWWDHLAGQAEAFGRSGITAIWLPPPFKGASGDFSNGYDVFDDYDLGSKKQKGVLPTRYGTRESLQRCSALMRANGIDVYVDIVENQRDGDDGHFKFEYADAFGNLTGGRFQKDKNDFHPHVPEDPGVFSDAFHFGRDLAPINGGVPKGQCGRELIRAAEWLTRAIDVQGYRLDNAKGVSTVFNKMLLASPALKDKFAVGEFADGNIQLISNWVNDVAGLSSAFDFPLHFALKDMCNNPGSFSMFNLDHAGFVGQPLPSPLRAVTFVENHDTDRGGVGGPIVQNKLLAYAYILTSEGYPCVFYRDYSTDKNCFGLKPQIDRLISIHERVANGPTQQRFKDNGVFAYERTGGSHLLVALNKDSGGTRTIPVQTGFGPNKRLENLTDDQAQPVVTNAHGSVTLTVPKNVGGRGYVCYGVSKAGIDAPFSPKGVRVNQEFEAAPDLDIKPAIENQDIPVGTIYADANTRIDLAFTSNDSAWSAATRLTLTITDPSGERLGTKDIKRGAATGAPLSVQTKRKGFHALIVRSSNTPPQAKAPEYTVAAAYSAPKTL